MYMDDSKQPYKAEALWMLTSAPGIDCFDTRQKKGIKNFRFPFPARPGQCMANSWVVVSGRNRENIWVGSDDKGIYGFNIRTEQYLHIKPGKACKSQEHLSGYHKVWEDSYGNLWTTNDDKEIVFYDQAKKKFFYHPVEKKEIDFSILVPVIWEDNGDNIWICTNSGMIKIDPQQKKIINCFPDKNNPGSISGRQVFAIQRINDSQLLVNSNNVQVFNKNTSSFSPFSLSVNGKELNSRGFWNIYKDRNGILWFTGWPGITSFDPRTFKTRRYELYDSSGARAFGGTIGMVEDNQGRYWTPSWGQGLYAFDAATSKVKRYTSQPGPNSLSTNFVSTIFKDSKGLLYMNGWEGGFICFDPYTEKFKVYHHDPNDKYSVSNENCHSFIEMNNGLIWFGTMGGGINVFNPTTQKFRAFTTRDGLVHNNVSSLIKDKKGRLWAGTRGSGISCFTPPSDPFQPNAKIYFRNYDVKDGISSNVINMSVGFCDTDGTLYFGTRDAGMFYFLPDDLEDNSFVPPVYITELRVQNKIVSLNDKDSILKTSIEFTKAIKLNYKQNMISFGFAALNFIHPERNVYAYKLEEYDQDWTYTDASRRFVTYTNLDPGKYIFKVKASNNDDVWNNTPAELVIFIAPPFWQTWWFRALIVLSIAIVFYGIYRYRIQQLKRLQTIRNNIASDLHDDIGSTLNSISIYSEVAKQQAGKDIPALELIGTNSRKIVESMSDIVWTINPENDSFEKIIARMRSFAHQLLKAKKVEYTFDVDEKLNIITLPMQVRKNFYLVFKEAVTNIVKYSQANRVSISLHERNKNIILKIRDNGKGIPVNAETQGNGLLNMKRRAEEIHARLNINSVEEEGTEIELTLKT